MAVVEWIRRVRSKNPIKRTLFALIITTLYMLLIAETDYTGKKLPSDASLATKAFKIHQSFFTNIFGSSPTEGVPSEPLTLLSILNYITLGYVGMWLNNYLSLFTTVLLYLLVPFEYTLLYDLISMNRQLSWLHSILYLGLWFVVLRNTFRWCKQLTTSPNQHDGSYGGIHWNILKAWAEVISLNIEYWVFGRTTILSQGIRAFRAFDQMADTMNDLMKNQGMTNAGEGGVDQNVSDLLSSLLRDQRVGDGNWPGTLRGHQNLRFEEVDDDLPPLEDIDDDNVSVE